MTQNAASNGKIDFLIDPDCDDHQITAITGPRMQSNQAVCRVLMSASDAGAQETSLRVFRSLLGKLSSDLLVEITQQELRIFSFADAASYIDEPLIAIEVAGKKETIRAVGGASRNCTGPGVKVINPFSHRRSMVSNFSYAQEILRFAFKSVHGKVLQAAPRVIMHQLEKNEGGLTDIEARVLSELAQGAGAREVVVYQGDRINPRHETFENIKSRTDGI